MRSRSLAALSLCAALAGCGSSSGQSGLGLWQPAAVTVFHGFTVKNADLHPYVAVANTGRDEIVLVDAVDDKPVQAPVLFRPLAIPVGEPRPSAILSASLGDSTATDPRADLLVVRSAGSTVLQVVKTWIAAGQGADTRVLPELDVDLAAGTAGAEVLAMVAAPVPVADGAGGFTAAAGRVRVVAALSGQRLSVVEFTRQPDGSILPGQPVVQELALVVGTAPIRFDAVSLAVNPALPGRVYAASRDPDPHLAGHGRGRRRARRHRRARRVDLARPRCPRPHQPGRGVHAARAPGGLGGRRARGARGHRPRPRLRLPRSQPLRRHPADRLRDRGARPRLRPARARTLAGVMPYLAPIAVPAVPVALVVSPPPVNPPSGSAEESIYAAPYMRIAPGSGVRLTTAVLEVPATDGLVYFVDLARWAIPNNGSILRLATSRTAVTEAVSGFAGEQRIGLWDVSPTTATPTGLAGAGGDQHRAQGRPSPSPRATPPPTPGPPPGRASSPPCPCAAGRAGRWATDARGWRSRCKRTMRPGPRGRRRWSGSTTPRSACTSAISPSSPPRR